MTICFSFDRHDWLAFQWPLAIVYGTLALALGVVGVLIASTGLQWWVLLLLPAFSWVGRRCVDILRFLRRGRQAVMLRVEEGTVIGVSFDQGQNWTPVLSPVLEDEGARWLLVGNGGGVRIPIPMARLSVAEQAVLVEAVRRRAAMPAP